MVVYSTTKYIGGHSDVVGGAVVVNDEETREKVAFLQNAAGAVPSPFDSWLDIRGLKTLDLRVKRHSANALKVAEWLESQPSDVIERVWYPGLESHPGHEIAARQMHGGFGGIGSRPAPRRPSTSWTTRRSSHWPNRSAVWKASSRCPPP